MNQYTEDFERVWRILPKRCGGNPKPRAFKAFAARLKEKVLLSELEAGARRYYNYCKQSGLLRTSYVMQAATFFSANTESWREDWELPKVEVKETLEQKAARLNIVAQPGWSWEEFERKVNQAR